jgi:glycosyltransferase involved in cell wall biosynthesis
MEQYLRYCLDSLLIEKHFNKLEVLVINDGSKDSSSEIAHEYQDKYPDVFRVIDKENGNYGSCINKGLQIATGKYVKVLDADDSFDTQNFEEFLGYLETIDADLILSDFAIVDEERTIKKLVSYDFPSDVALDLEMICSTNLFKDMQMHAVTYRLANLRKMNYFQTEGISYTDQQWIFTPMKEVRTVYNFKKYVYKYLIGRIGQTVSPAIKQKRIKQVAACVVDMLKSYIAITQMSENLRDYFFARLVPLAKEVYVTLLANYDEASKTFLIHYDDQLNHIDKSFYALLGDRNVSSFCGFRYIHYWRCNYLSLNPIIIRLLSKVYLLLLRIKDIIRRLNNV